MRITQKIKSKIIDINDALKHQECVTKLNIWQTENSMKFNDLKFMPIQFGKNIDLTEEYNYITPELDNIITPSSSVRYLGVEISSDGTYNDHIVKVINRANQRISLL